MAPDQWVETARRHAKALANLVELYYPASRSDAHRPSLPITAQRAEEASVSVRGSVLRRGGNPAIEPQEALVSGDHVKIKRLLGEAWFGVPESTSCWGIEGFREAVDLLDDPPEDA